MATATVDSATNDEDHYHSHFNHLHTESLPLVDLRLLSQSELLSLSLCFSFSSSSFNHQRQNEADVATLKIDRSVFNESAGSRKQTFSRLRLAPRNSNLLHFSSRSITDQIPVEFTQDEENSQIVCLLKSLFGSNSNSIENNNNNVHNYINQFSDDNLISVPITYNKAFQALHNLSAAGYRKESATSITGSTKKRKRGRPPKNNNYNINNVIVNGERQPNNAYEEEEMEIVAAITDSMSKQGILQQNSCNIYNNTVNEKRQEITSECENVRTEEEEKTGGMKLKSSSSSEEDPYGEELRRRTTGMHKEAELLGFLEGLDGEWMSKRKKRKIVDASVLGDVLPMGWKLILCNKRRAGFFWLDCTGYISPDGQQFMSCKEVTSHLLLKEHQDASESGFAHIDGNIHSTGIISSGNDADLTLKDNKNGDDLLSCPALPVTISEQHEKQTTTLTTRVNGQVQTVEKYKCHKCTMAFEEPDELLQHLLSSHQRAPKGLRQGTSMNEEVIMKNGRYECQFCRKTFEERHRFNGHLGNHIKDYFKRVEASGGVRTIQRRTGQSSVAVRSDVLEMRDSNGFGSGSVAIHSEIKLNAEIGSAVLSREIKENSTVESCCGKQDTVFSMTNDKAEKMNEVTDFVAVEINLCSGAESVLSNNENSSICKSSKETTILKHTFDRMNNIGSQEEGSKNCSLAAVEGDLACVADNNEDKVIMGLVDEHNQERDSDNGVLSLDSEENAFGGENVKDKLLLVERDIVGKDKLRTHFGNNCSLQEDVAADINEPRSAEGCFAVPCGSDQRYGSANNLDGFSTSTMAEMAHENDSKRSLSLSLDEKTCLLNNKLNQGSTNTATESIFGEMGVSSDSLETAGFLNKNTLTLEDAVTRCELESTFGSCSEIPLWNELTCFGENDTNRTPGCTGKKYWQEKESDGSKLTLFGGEQPLGLGFENNVVKVSNYPLGVLNNDEFQRSKDNDCSKYADPVGGDVTNLELGRRANNILLDPSGNELTFAMKDFGLLSGTSKSLAQDRSSESSLHGQLCDGQKLNNVNLISFIAVDQHRVTEVKSSNDGKPRHSHMERVDSAKNMAEEYYLKHSSVLTSGKFQQKPRLEDLYPKKNESVNGFISCTQSSENATSVAMWRTDEGDLLSTVTDTSSQLVHSSGCFPTCDVMSDKGESEPSGDKFRGMSGFEVLRSGSLENMEYNFMTSHSDESKVFSYGADVAQGLESSVWFKKEAMPLLPKMTSRRYIRTFCVWCRNEFHCEALESEAQAGSLGLTCAACKAKFSGQFNLL